MMEQNQHQTLPQVQSDENISPNKKNNNTLSADSDNANGCFDCNICLDSANDPIVTLCGHLYCWPCIYKWLNVQNDEGERETSCPVCKAQISQSSVIPLYGRGPSPSEPKRAQSGGPMPRRPRPTGVHTPAQNLPINTNPLQGQFGNYTSNFGSPTAGILRERMFGEMVFARMFGPDTGVFPYFYNYPVAGNAGPGRIRRQEMQLDKSLNRVSIFLFCFFILCLLLF